MSDPTPSTQPIPSQAYPADYYETACEGYREFYASHGRTLPLRLRIPLELAGIKPGMRIVDIGCGRGEVVFQSLQAGAVAWGLDYSPDAVAIAAKLLKENLGPDIYARCQVQQSDATQLPFPDDVMDRVFMLDVVEHLTPSELSEALREVYRVLKPGGHLVVHTMPSLWYYRYGYPIFRLLQAMRGVKLPSNPRQRYPYSHLHINEQTPSSLRRVLLENGYKIRVWLQSTQSYEEESNKLVRWWMNFSVKVYPFRWIFCDDIFAIGKKC